MKAVLISAQFLVELPKGVALIEAESFGVDWLEALDTDALDYRHPKIAGVYLRPVLVQVIDPKAENVFEDSNLMQL